MHVSGTLLAWFQQLFTCLFTMMTPTCSNDGFFVLVPSVGLKIPEVSLVSPFMSMKTRKLLKGHQSRIVSFDWSPDKRHLVSGGQV